jgi:hypothetical protein
VFLIFGFRSMLKQLGVIGWPCDNCTRRVLQVVKRTQWFTLFFIPIIPLKHRYLTMCPNCRAVRDVRPEALDQIKAALGKQRTAHLPSTPSPSIPHTTPEVLAPLAQSGFGSSSGSLDYPTPTGLDGPTPGWFPDRSAGVQRYWDGTRWTGDTAPIDR